MLPKLGVLDGYDRDGKEVADEEEEEEEEVEEEDDSDEEVGLEYLQKELSVCATGLCIDIHVYVYVLV